MKFLSLRLSDSCSLHGSLFWVRLNVINTYIFLLLKLLLFQKSNQLSNCFLVSCLAFRYSNNAWTSLRTTELDPHVCMKSVKLTCLHACFGYIVKAVKGAQLYLRIYFILFLLWLRCAACGMLVFQPGIEPASSAVKILSPNHWTTRDFPRVQGPVRTMPLPCSSHVALGFSFLTWMASPDDIIGEGNGNSSTLAWKIPWTEEPGRLQSMGSRRVKHDWATALSLFTFMHWRRKWQPTPVL